MNILKQTVCIISLCLLISANKSETGSFKSQTNAKFAKTIARKGVQIVDCRKDVEFASGHIPKAIHIDFLKEDFKEKSLSLLDKSRPVAIYCLRGGRSKDAGKILAENGYTVFELDKGIAEWNGKLEKQ